MIKSLDDWLKDAKRQSEQAWHQYSECQETSCNDKTILAAHDQYIRAHNKVAMIAQKFKSDSKTQKSIPQKSRE